MNNPTEADYIQTIKHLEENEDVNMDFIRQYQTEVYGLREENKSLKELLGEAQLELTLASCRLQDAYNLGMKQTKSCCSRLTIIDKVLTKIKEAVE